VRERRDGGIRIRCRRQRLLGHEIGVEVGQPDSGRGRTNIYADNAPPLLVQVEETRSAPPWDMTARALPHPILFNQLFGDYRDGAALKPGMTGQVCPRNGLMIAYQIEHDSTVDVARRLARRHLKIGKIDLSHFNSSAPIPTLNRRSEFRAVLNSTVELYHL